MLPDTTEEWEDAEDIACAEAREDELSVPLSDVLKDYEEKYGSLQFSCS
jgi:hypothetical protein